MDVHRAHGIAIARYSQILNRQLSLRSLPQNDNDKLAMLNTVLAENNLPQFLPLVNRNLFGNLSLKYLDEKKDTNNILESGNEVLNIGFKSKKFKKFSEINLNSSYNLLENKYNEYSLGYNYYDECFGITLDFERKFYEDTDLKPKDTLTLMFSFKNLGSYQSTNLAVSENDKQDIEWENISVNNDLFD